MSNAALNQYILPLSSLFLSSTVPKAPMIPIKRLMASPRRGTAWVDLALTPTTTFGWQPLTPLARAPPVRWWRLAQPSRPLPLLLDRSGLCLDLTKLRFSQYIIKNVVFKDAVLKNKLPLLFSALIFYNCFLIDHLKLGCYTI